MGKKKLWRTPSISSSPFVLKMINLSPQPSMHSNHRSYLFLLWAGRSAQRWQTNFAISQRKIHSEKSLLRLTLCDHKANLLIPPKIVCVLKLSGVWLWMTHLTTPSLNRNNRECILPISPPSSNAHVLTNDCHVAWTEHDMQLSYSKILQGNGFRLTLKNWLVV